PVRTRSPAPSGSGVWSLYKNACPREFRPAGFRQHITRAILMTTKEIVEKVNASFLEGNTEASLELCADDVVWTMVGDNHVRGKENLRAWMASMNSEPPSFTVREIIAEGDFAACHG